MERDMQRLMGHGKLQLGHDKQLGLVQVKNVGN